MPHESGTALGLVMGLQRALPPPPLPPPPPPPEAVPVEEEELLPPLPVVEPWEPELEVAGMPPVPVGLPPPLLVPPPEPVPDWKAEPQLAAQTASAAEPMPMRSAVRRALPEF